MADDGRVHQDRQRAESFGAAATEYDRFRPSYPAALLDDLVADRPADALDVGCGTGKAGRLLAERGVSVLGVEIDPQMAAVARSHGLPVEVASFETWDAAGRRFDLITCGQAWHWVDPAIGGPKAAGLLRPGGRLALFWNYAQYDAATHDALAGAYRQWAPELTESVLPLGPGLDSDHLHAPALAAGGRFADVETRDYRWEHTYSGAQWLALVNTHSQHLTFDPRRRAALDAGLEAAITTLGGSVVTHYGTYAVFARTPV